MFKKKRKNVFCTNYFNFNNVKNLKMYRLIPLRQLRRTAGVVFDEIVPSDIPVINGIDRVIHKANGISPGPVKKMGGLIYTGFLEMGKTSQR